MDANNDGYPDILFSLLTKDNVLFFNDKGSFSRHKMIELPDPLFSFSTWTWDINDDGFEDIFIANYDLRYESDVAGQFYKEINGVTIDANPPAIYINQKNGSFKNETKKYGMSKFSGFVMGSNFGDADNDGDLDMYLGTGAPSLTSIIPNRFFSFEDGSFSDETFKNGLGHLQKGNGVAFDDYDNDGDADIYSVMGGAFEGDNFPNVLFENNAKNGNAVYLRLLGNYANKSAIGARISYTYREDGIYKTRYRTVDSGGSFGAQSFVQRLGIGSAQKITEVSIIWPDKAQSKQVLKNLETGKKYTIVQGERVGVGEVLKATKVDKSSAHQHHHH